MNDASEVMYKDYNKLYVFLRGLVNPHPPCMQMFESMNDEISDLDS